MKSKSLHKKKSHKKSNRKTKKNIKKIKKGGFLFDQKLNIGGLDLSRESGKKQYNPKTGKWDDVICYKIGPIPFCKIKPSSG